MSGYGGENIADVAPFLTLRQSDLDSFHRLGITDDLLKATGIQRVTDAEARKDFGIAGGPTRDYSGLVFPYRSPETGHRSTARLRRDNPETENGAPKNKYVSGYGDRRRLYFPPQARQRLDDAETVVALVEAEKSSLPLSHTPSAPDGRSSRLAWVVAGDGVAASDARATSTA